MSPDRSPTARRVSRVLTAALAVAPAACVVPVGPDFETVPNRSPQVVSATPPVGAVIASMMGTAQVARVVLADQDPRDALHFKWLVDYPPATDSFNQVVLPGTLDLSRANEVALAPPCANLAVGRHRLTLAVSDRAFLPPEEAARPEEKLTAIDTARGAHSLILVWFYDCI